VLLIGRAFCRSVFHKKDFTEGALSQQVFLVEIGAQQNTAPK
jgi:hypothetical protein